MQLRSLRESVIVTSEVPVSERLRRPHPLVSRLRKGEGMNDRLRPLDVTRNSVSRALRIMHALLTEAERRGYGVRESSTTYQGGQREACIVVSGHEYALTVRERNSRLQVWLPREYFGRRQWNDGIRRALEHKLDEVLQELESRAVQEEARRINREAERLERQRAWERAMEQARKRHAEAYWSETLRQQVASWRLARDIRKYCDGLRATLSSIDEVARADVESWLAWAETHADEIDPIVHPPGQPEVPVPKPEDLRNHLDGLSPFGP